MQLNCTSYSSVTSSMNIKVSVIKLNNQTRILFPREGARDNVPPKTLSAPQLSAPNPNTVCMTYLHAFHHQNTMYLVALLHTGELIKGSSIPLSCIRWNGNDLWTWDGFLRSRFVDEWMTANGQSQLLGSVARMQCSAWGERGIDVGEWDLKYGWGAKRRRLSLKLGTD